MRTPALHHIPKNNPKSACAKGYFRSLITVRIRVRVGKKSSVLTKNRAIKAEVGSYFIKFDS